MTTTSFATMFHTDPTITDEELTPAVMEEIGKAKYDIISAMLPFAGNTDLDLDMLALELEPLTPTFIRALAAALKQSENV
jgi:hypothetical protein